MPKIMIVDDVATIRKIVSAVMAGVGYEVVEAATGEEALAIAAGNASTSCSST